MFHDKVLVVKQIFTTTS